MGVLLFVLISTCFGLNVSILPHSHLDAGWLYSYQEYFDFSVFYIGNTLLQNFFDPLLSGKSNRTFNWCEIGFLKKFLASKTSEHRQLFRDLVLRKQIGFVGGGFVQNDEAVTTFSSVIDQMTIGHEFIAEEFGLEYVPLIGWQIDPFGASAVTPILFKSMDFKYHVIDRVDYPLKDQWRSEGRLEFMWNGLLTHCLTDHYSSPTSFDWEDNALDNPRIDFANVVERAKTLVEIFTNRSKGFEKTDELMVLFGDDFKYQNSNMQYANLDALISFVNQNYENISIQYKTAQTYFQSISHKSFPSIPGDVDLFPYRKDVDFQFYTGYYTSRPLLKKMSRNLESWKNAVEILRVLNGKNCCTDCDTLLQDIRESAAIMTHHDAITGTASNYTVISYATMMDIAVQQAQEIASQCMSNEKDNVISGFPSFVQVFNPLNFERSELICVKVDPDIQGKIDISNHNAQYLNDSICWIGSLVPFGTTSFNVTKKTTFQEKQFENSGNFSLNNSYLDVLFSSEGELKSLNGFPANLAILEFNTSDVPNDWMSNRYFFIPNMTDFERKEVSRFNSSVWKRTGAVFDEIEVILDTRNVSVVYRVFHTQDYDLGSFLEVQVKLGTISWNKDIAMNVELGKTNGDGKLYSDQNGFVMRERTDNSSFTLGGKWHPSTCVSELDSPSSGRLSIFSSRSHGIASPLKQSLTVSLQRRLNCTNSVVLNEALNDTSVIVDDFRIAVNSKTPWYKKSMLSNLAPVLSVSSSYVRDVSYTKFHSSNLQMSLTSRGERNYVRLVNLSSSPEIVVLSQLFTRNITDAMIVSSNHVHEKGAPQQQISIAPQQILTLRFKWSP